MVDDQLGVDAEGFVEPVLAIGVERGTRNVAQSEKLHRLELLRDAFTDAPEIRQRAVCPEFFPEGHFVERRNANAVPVGPGFLGFDVHGDLGEKEIGADARRRRDAGIVQHVAHHRHGQLVGRHAIGAEIICHIDKNLVDGIDNDVLRRDVFQIGGVDPAAVFLVQAHPRRRDDVGNLQRRVFFYGFRVEGGCGELVFSGFRVAPDCTGTDSGVQPFPVDLLHALNHFKQTRPAGNAVGFQRGRYRQADGLIRPAFVGNDQIGGQRIEMALHAFHAGVKALCVDGHILPNLFRHARRSPFRLISLPPLLLPRTSGRPGWRRTSLSIRRTDDVPVP